MNKSYYDMENEALLDELQKLSRMLDISLSLVASPKQIKHTEEQIARIRAEILNRMNFMPPH